MSGTLFLCTFLGALLAVTAVRTDGDSGTQASARAALLRIGLQPPRAPRTNLTPPHCKGVPTPEWIRLAYGQHRDEADAALQRRAQAADPTCRCNLTTGAECRGNLRIRGGVSEKLRKSHSSGFGALFFIHVVNGISFAERHCLLPRVEMDPANARAYYDPARGNPWEYYFQPVANGSGGETLSMTDWDIVWSMFDWEACCTEWAGQMGLPVVHSPAPFSQAERIVQKYYRLQPEVAKQADEEWRRMFGHEPVEVIGLHVRGTDSGNRAVQADAAKPYVQGWLMHHPHGMAFLATDSQKVIEAIKHWPEALRSRVKFREGVARGSGTKAIFGKNAAKSVHDEGLDVLMDILFLARCNWFVRSTSLTSQSVMLWNPDLRPRSSPALQSVKPILFATKLQKADDCFSSGVGARSAKGPCGQFL